MLPTPNSWTNFLALTDVLDGNDLYEMRMINDSGGKVLYIGKNKTPNAATSDPTWYIKKISYDTNGFINYVQLPVNGPGFLYIWDDYSTYF